MVFRVPLNRRRFARGLGGLAAAAAFPLSGFSARLALAQDGGTVDAAWMRLDKLNEEAVKLGLKSPRTALQLGPATETGEVYDLVPAILDFIDEVEANAMETRGIGGSITSSLVDQANDLLIEITQAERSPRDMEEGEQAPEEEAATRALQAAPYPTMPPLSEIEGEYRELFQSCTIRDQYVGSINQYVGIMLKDENRKRYEEIYEETCVPWFFVAGIHALESSFNFRTHLHNGDPLSAKTRHVPANRLPGSSPPYTWVESAVDALTMKKYDKETSWTLPEILYRWEKYNGVRSRMIYKINTPYLWSFSQHYTKGKFVADGQWDGNAVSKQPGAAVLLRRLVDMGEVRLEGV